MTYRRPNLLRIQVPCSIREWFAEWTTRGAGLSASNLADHSVYASMPRVASLGLLRLWPLVAMADAAVYAPAPATSRAAAPIVWIPVDVNVGIVEHDSLGLPAAANYF